MYCLRLLQAGAFAAFTVDLLVYPLDTIKTRVQSPEYKQLYTNVSTKAIDRSLFRGLYQGIGSVILATIPSCSCAHFGLVTITHSSKQEPSSQHMKLRKQSSVKHRYQLQSPTPLRLPLAS